MRVPEPMRVMYGHLNWRALFILWLMTGVATGYVVRTDASIIVASVLAGSIAGGLSAVLVFSGLQGVAERDARERGTANPKR